MSTHHGAFCWYELMTTDAAAAADFYAKVVGWTARDGGSPGIPYTVLSAGEAGVAGIFTLSPEMLANGARPGWIGYIAVDDVDAYCAKVTGAGGAVHRPPADIPGVGRFSVVADPQGAAFVLFRAAGDMASAPPPPAIPEKPGWFGWRELYAGDGATAFDFYAGLFGWTKGQAYDMGQMGTYQLFVAGGEEIGGMMTKPPMLPVTFWNYYVLVDAIGAAIERLTAGGGKVMNGPAPVPGGLIMVQALDPQGAMFSLLSRNP